MLDGAILRACVVPGAERYAMNTDRTMTAAAMSAFRMVGDFGYVIGPILLGFLVDVQGPQTALLAAAAISVLAAYLFLKYAPETYRKKS